MKTRLTEIAVSRLKPPKSGKYAWHPDALLPSFGVRVYTTGRRVWGITRRWDGATHPTFRKIGELPAMSLADARTKAREILADPGSAGAHEAQADDGAKVGTFGEMAEAFLAHRRTKRGRLLRDATVKEYRRALITYAAHLHHKPVADIRRRDAAALIRTVAEQRGSTSARATRAAGSRFYSWLMANDDRIESNPFTGTEGYDVPKGKRVLGDGELSAIWSATDDRHDFNLIIRLCLWTGCRRAEAGGMRWSELVDGVWLIPGERTKNHRPLALPLPRQGLAALEGWHRFVGRDLVFGRGPNGFQAWSKSKERLDQRLGFNQSWDLHDSRRTVETRMAGLGIPKEHVNKVLNHAVGPVTAAYDQWSYLPEKRAALQSWADELERVIGRDEARVIQLHR
jgi:integrase